MSELQTDDNGVNDEVEAETGTAGSDLATDSAAEREEKDPAVVAQEKAQKAINKQHAKYREEERKRIAAESAKSDLESRLAELEAKDSTVVIPPMPDAYDENFTALMAERDAAIRREAEIDAQQSVSDANASAQRKAAEGSEKERVNGLLGSFDNRISALGLKPEEVGKAVAIVADYGISPEVGEFILGDEDGPLITQYLAANPLELDELRGMSAIQAALKINSDIRSSAAMLKPTASGAPDPAETLNGRGATEKVHPLLKGTTFV